MSNYTIHLTRREGRCIASIPELCITGKAANPGEALANVMMAESEVLEKLTSSGLPLPPPVDRIHPFPKVHELFMKAALFSGRVIAAFIIFLVLSVAAAVVIYPSFDTRVRTYIQSPASREHMQKMLNHFGISVCIENGKELKADHP
jgi:hypothetical protein